MALIDDWLGLPAGSVRMEKPRSRDLDDPPQGNRFEVEWRFTILPPPSDDTVLDCFAEQDTELEA